MLVETPYITIDTTEKPISQIIDFIEILSNNLHGNKGPSKASAQEIRELSSIARPRSLNNKKKVSKR